MSICTVCVLLKQMKRTKAIQTLVISWMFETHHLSPSCCSRHNLCVSRGSSFLFITLLLGTWSQGGSIGMVSPHGNQLCAGSEAFISVLELWMVLIFRDELPQPNEDERDGGGGGGWGEEAREQAAEREKSRRNFLPQLPRGVQCVGGVLYVSLASVSSTHASLSNQIRSRRRSSFIQLECACSCVAHLLLIKQWQALKNIVWRRLWKASWKENRRTVWANLTGWKFIKQGKLAWAHCTLHVTSHWFKCTILQVNTYFPHDKFSFHVSQDAFVHVCTVYPSLY